MFGCEPRGTQVEIDFSKNILICHPTNFMCLGLEILFL